jgi:transcriptional antiterminator RfaH
MMGASMPYWACAQVAPLQEGAAQHFLRLNGFESYCPRLRVTRRSHGRQVLSKPPLFPSYVFVAVSSGWWAARWCPHVVRLILNGAAPAVVSAAVIDGLKAREVAGLIELLNPPRFRPGDKVRVLHGPFIGLVGLHVGMRPRQRVEILLTLLGGSQRVTLAADAVEPAL